MNDTNRALNRIVLALIGLIFLGAGALAVTAAVWPMVGQQWSTILGGAAGWWSESSDATRIGGGSVSWVGLAAVAAVLLLAILLIAALTRVGGRRSRTVLRAGGAQNELGRVTITEAFARDALKNSLGASDDILSTHVTANTIRTEPVMHVSVTPRQSTDPRELVERIDRLVANLATLTGQEIATYISVHTGLRARLAHDRRRVS